MYRSGPKSRATAVFLILFLLVGQLGLSPAPAMAANSAENSDIMPGVFKDVSQTNPNFIFINFLSKRGLLNGFPDGTFQPAAGLTRAEAAAVLVKAAGLKTEPAKAVFKDVRPNHWAAPSIAAAKDAGLLTGYPDGTFRPEARLTRAEGITLILKLSKQPDSGVELPVLADLSPRHWAARPIAVGLASEMIGLASDNSRFLPDAVLTRGSLSRALAVLLTEDPALYTTSLTDQLNVVSGSVTVIRAGSAAAETITGSTGLKPGDTVSTGTSGLADITFPDGTGLRLEKECQLTIKEAIGRSYIKADGTPGTAVESLTVDLKSGNLFGALAANAQAGDETTAQAQAMSLGNLSENKVRTAAAAAKPLPWWKQSGVKRTKVKIDMPTGVAAIRGTFWWNKVNRDGSFDTTLLTGSAEITAAGQTVDLSAGQRTKVAGTGAPPATPAPLTTEDKKEWVQQKQWAQTRAKEITAQQPQVLPPPSPAEKPEQPALPPQQPQQPQTPVTNQPKSPTDIISIVESAITSAGDSVPPAATFTDSDDSDTTIFVTGIKLDTYEVSLVVGSTQTVTAHVYPEDATNQSLTWTSSNPSVATVDNGVITPVSGGYAKITATSVENSNISDYCEVTVAAPASGGNDGGTTPTPQTTLRISSIELASLSAHGLQANNSSGGGEYASSLSHDGRYVAFYSNADNLVEGDTDVYFNGFYSNPTDIFVRDRTTGTTVRVSVDSNGNQGNSGSRAPKISADGRYVAFTSGATNLVSGDTNGREDVFVHDRDADNDGVYDETDETGAISTVRVSVAADGTQANGGSSAPSISVDGRYITFYSGATNLVAGDTNGLSDVFVHDLKTGSTQRVSVSTDGFQADAECYFPAISPDGRYVMFTSGSTTLVPGLITYGIFVRDLVYNTTSFLAEGSDPDMSYDGQFVAYSYGDDIFIRDRDPNATGVFDEVYADSKATVGINGLPANEFSYKPTISWDGRYVAFTSHATNLIKDDNNDDGDIFVWDNLNKITKRVSAPVLGEEANYGSWYQAMSGDGRCIAFTSGASNLVAGDSNNRDDIFLAALTLDAPLDTIAPAAPTDQAANIGPSWIKLAWNAVVDNTSVIKYHIYRGSAGSASLTEIGSVAGSVYSFWDTGLSPATTYEYYVLAEDEDGNISASPTPLPFTTTVEASGTSEVVSLAAGEDYSVVRLYDSTARAWGSNYSGELGTPPDSAAHNAPGQVPGLADITAIAAGYQYSLALGSDGTVWSWGENSDGQLGNRFAIDYSTVDGYTPMRVVSPEWRLWQQEIYTAWP